MPRFRFVAADSTGHVNDGTIDAATQTAARNKLATNGLAVRELEEIGTGAAQTPAAGRRSFEASSDALEAIPMRRPARAEPVEAAGRGSSAPLVIAVIALIISIASAFYSTTRDPYSGRLSRYDFSTPEAAYRSHLKMQANADLPAMMELQRRSEGKHLRDKLESVQIHPPEDCRGKKILFVEYTIDAILTREVHFFEPDPNHSRSWKITHISDPEIRAVSQELADRVARWPQSRTGDFAPIGRDRHRGIEK
jgi:hypothetical protein